MYKVMLKILEKDPLAYIEVTGIKGKFKGITGLASPLPNLNLVELWIGKEDGSDDCCITVEQFNEEFVISDIYWEGGK